MGIKEKIKGEVKKEKGDRFIYMPGSISRLPGPDEYPSDSEMREQITDYRIEAKSKELCLRCLINSDGEKRNSVKGLINCKVCGSPA